MWPLINVAFSPKITRTRNMQKKETRSQAIARIADRTAAQHL